MTYLEQPSLGDADERSLPIGRLRKGIELTRPGVGPWSLGRNRAIPILAKARFNGGTQTSTLMTADQIISQCKSIATMHFPDEHSHEHASYHAGLFESKLREVLLHVSFAGL